VIERLEETPAGGPAVVVALGAALFAVGTWNFLRELASLTAASGPVAAYLLDGLPALGIVYLGVWLSRSGFSSTRRWQVAFGTTAGAVIVAGALALTILIRVVVENRTVGEPVFALLVNAGAGAIAGGIVGITYARARNDAAGAARARDRFEFLNSMLRHDVLNRMTIIRARADFIAESVDGREREFAETISAQVDAVSDEIDRTRAVLDALDSDDASLRRVDLTETLRDQARTLRATDESVTVETAVPDGLTVRADELLSDVFANLLSNAVEHNDGDEPRVWVEAERADEAVVVRIADDGPGIPDGMKDAVFRRDDTDIHDNIAGSGFGLFFVDTMVEKYGGAVEVRDRDPTGSVFVLRFRPG
jgi:signal transduction histidine kinase